MRIFPAIISRSYESKVKNRYVDYQAALSYGLSFIKDSPQKALDSCTGTGFAAFMALKNFPDALVTGVDQSTTMIEIAHDKVDSLDVDRIKFEIGNAARLGY